MPGLYGGYLKDSVNNLDSLSKKMSSSLSINSATHIDSYIDDQNGIFAGRVSIGVLNPEPQPVKSNKNNIQLFLHGELLPAEKVHNEALYLLDQFCTEGFSVFNKIDGMYHAIIIDTDAQKIYLIGDKFGLLPLYYSIFQGGIVFAGEVKALLTCPNVSKEPDNHTIADFYHYGQALNNRTLFKDIQLLPPGSVLSFDLTNSTFEINNYWEIESLFKENGQYLSSVTMDNVIQKLAKAVDKNSSHLSELGLSLSGGLDSRGILAGLKNKTKGITTYTLGIPGCADENIANKMAQLCQTSHDFIELDESYMTKFESMVNDMIQLSDGLYHPHESTEMLALEYFKKDKFKILLRGHGGEIAKAALAYPVMVRPEVHSFTQAKQVLDFIFNSTNKVLADNSPDDVFTPEFAKIMKTAPRASLEESCGDVATRLAPADVCLHYYIREHVRRQVVASLAIFRSQLEIRMPYMDAEYIEKLLSMPVHMRNEGEVHTAFVKASNPKLIKVRNSNTGAPLDAGPTRLFITDKFNSAMKRLRVPGYKHYTEFQEWHRKAFREQSEKIIFSKQTASRGRYNMDNLRNIFDLHMSGKKNYGHLLGTIVGLEIWQRMYVDQEDQ